MGLVEHQPSQRVASASSALAHMFFTDHLVPDVDSGVLRAAVEVTKEDVRTLYVLVGGEDTRHVETEMNPSRLQVI